MPQIKAITEAMLTKAQNIEKRANDIGTSQERVMNSAKNLGSDFSGKIPNLFLQNLLSMEKTYRAVHETLLGYSAFLANAANQYEFSDKEIARLIAAFAAVAGGGAVGGSNPGVTGGGASGVNISLEERNRGEILNDENYYHTGYFDKEYKRFDGVIDKLQNNCKEFARRVISDTFEYSLGSTNSNNYELLPGNPPLVKIGGPEAYAGESFSAGAIAELFKNSQNGDVVQMSWKNGYSTQHTAIISGITDTGVSFLQANSPGGTITVKEYSFEELTGFFSHPPYSDKYDGGKMKSHGLTIYRVPGNE